MNSILLVVMGMVLLTAELIPAAPAPYFEEGDVADMVDPALEFADSEPAKRSRAFYQQCLLQCLVCHQNMNMGMGECESGCKGSANPGKSRAYNACHRYLHSGRK